ncbi:hypothetical protein SERLA73DRAFT_63047 [Serpula lacrymans var. lacrymans S7.3]|uniref:Uncharacterized protein n=2 Tax=Serpula lacrymans var. lacrymans TaxID=341189 RepID=F8QBT4_SERL3|nr:hypothetical protein SERLA73DRAFT_63047 [Serpula lacrymans var. lacrymans S7.3]
MLDCGIKQCLAYTGPFSDLKYCPECGEALYNQDILLASNDALKTPHQTFSTIPLAEQL